MTPRGIYHSLKHKQPEDFGNLTITWWLNSSELFGDCFTTQFGTESQIWWPAPHCNHSVIKTGVFLGYPYIPISFFSNLYVIYFTQNNFRISPFWHFGAPLTQASRSAIPKVQYPVLARYSAEVEGWGESTFKYLQLHKQEKMHRPLFKKCTNIHLGEKSIGLFHPLWEPLKIGLL